MGRNERKRNEKKQNGGKVEKNTLRNVRERRTDDDK